VGITQVNPTRWNVTARYNTLSNPLPGYTDWDANSFSAREDGVVLVENATIAAAITEMQEEIAATIGGLVNAHALPPPDQGVYSEPR
jgi:hypothetical protein